MSISPDDFKKQLNDVIACVTLHESNWNSEKWKSLYELINQEVLTVAFEKHDLVKLTFPKLDMITRNCKSIKRVEKKMTEQPPSRENYFKVISDFIAVRIHCDIGQIANKIDYIKQIVSLDGGEIRIRSSTLDRPYGSYMNSEFVDIVQYVYVYLVQIGYVIEFQICHEFSSHTFAIDSALRDNPQCGKIDLWNEDFYDNVKAYILNKANGKFNDDNAKNNILIKANKIHLNNVPDDLVNILNKL
jgi:hypothetical protein